MTTLARLVVISLLLTTPLAVAQNVRANAGASADLSAIQAGINDYPTAARAEYVFACMNTNGGNQQSLQRCACAIDVIASALPYSDYEKSETILRMQHAGGYLAQEFRIPESNAILRQLQEAQAEADFTCF